MRFSFLLFLLLVSLAMSSQYYYDDILGSAETRQLMQNFLANKVKMVTATGYDGKGVKATDFAEVSEIRENGQLLRQSSISGLKKTVTLTRFDNEGRVISITDSAAEIQGITTYTYDAAGRISRVENKVLDSANSFNHTETHWWYYNDSGKPEKMWRVIGNTGGDNSPDSLEIRFVPDEKGLIAEERTFRRGVETGYLYYYYDDQGRLLDIVRFNTRLKKLLPDIMFEYDENGRVAQKTTTTSSLHLGYLIWRYIYNDKGLKTKEVLFNSDKQITGKIEFSYTF
ncbi:MAG: RHS repeat protein [Sphingobacteriales bacterium]|nr:RHS repeat protein [Sphingobacteriales bacterium]